MLNLTWAIVGGVVRIGSMGGVLWLVTQVLVDVVDWIAAGIERVWRKEHGK